MAVFRTGQILAGERSPEHVRRQLHRWSERGRIIKLRRGVYMLRERGPGERAHPFVVANYLKTGSYVSLQSALSHYGMIPEYVPVITSVTTGRPETVTNDAGHFQFRRIHRRLFGGFERGRLAAEQHAFLATPEKALLDLLYLTPESDNIDLLKELRLEPPDGLTPSEFHQSLKTAAEETGVAKLHRRFTGAGHQSPRRALTPKRVFSDATWPQPNLEFLNQALKQTSWPGPAVTTDNWKQAVRRALGQVDWSRAVEDVRSFLERPNEVDFIRYETFNELPG